MKNIIKINIKIIKNKTKRFITYRRIMIQIKNYINMLEGDRKKSTQINIKCIII